MQSTNHSNCIDRFSQISRYEIIENGKVVENYRDELTNAQKEILEILKISEYDSGMANVEFDI